jgi:hypothetical protein
MQFDELTSLIAIRDYVVNSINLPTIDRKMVNELNGIRLLLDEKIISLLTGDEFKDYIGYKDVQEAKQRAANITNIYSGLNGRK